mgnify:CR=1 FL=1
MLKDLIKLANDLDSKGLTKEANTLDDIIKRVIVKESLDASGLGGYGAASRPAPRWPGDPGDAAIKQQTKNLDKINQQESTLLDWMQVALDAIGLVPVYGEPFDAANSAIHAIRGKPLMSLLSAISVMPIYGDAIGKGTKLLLWGIRTGKAMKFGANTYTVASLGKTLKGQLDKVNDGEVKGLLDEIDGQTGKPKGTMYSMYNEKVKKTINDAAAGKIKAATA